MTLNDMFKALKNNDSSHLSHNDRFKLLKMTKSEISELNPLRTADNQILYTSDGNPIYTVN